jgi:hypothetical protein
VRSDLIVKPQPSRRDEKACQQKNVYRPLQQFAPLEDDNRSQFYNDRRFNVIYRKLVSARSAACRIRRNFVISNAGIDLLGVSKKLTGH